MFLIGGFLHCKIIISTIFSLIADLNVYTELTLSMVGFCRSTLRIATKHTEGRESECLCGGCRLSEPGFMGLEDGRVVVVRTDIFSNFYDKNSLFCYIMHELCTKSG